MEQLFHRLHFCVNRGGYIFDASAFDVHAVEVYTASVVLLVTIATAIGAFLWKKNVRDGVLWYERSGGNDCRESDISETTKKKITELERAQLRLPIICHLSREER